MRDYKLMTLVIAISHQESQTEAQSHTVLVFVAAPASNCLINALSIINFSE